MRLYAESALLWLLLTPIAVAQVILVLLVACDRCGLPCCELRRTRRIAVAATTSRCHLRAAEALRAF